MSASLAQSWTDGQRREQRYAATTFRLLLGALASPGTLGQLADPSFLGEIPAATPEPGESPLNRFAVGAMYTLLDSEVSVLLATGGRWLERAALLATFLMMRTGARWASPDAAQFVCVLDGDAGDLLPQLHRGTLAEPESSATVVLCVQQLRAEAAGATGAQPTRACVCELELTGPGIATQHWLAITGLTAATLRQLTTLRREYPLGLDYVLVDATGLCVGLPRTTRINVLTSREG